MRPQELRLLTLGGTIAASRSQGAQFNSGQALLEKLAIEGVELRVEDLLAVSSTQMSLDEAMSAVSALGRANADDGVRGVVISMGTGTMEEVAFLADLVMRARKPLVFTGAMEPPGPRSDGPANLHDALLVAGLGERMQGVYVCMAGEVHSAADVTKSHASRRDAFKSPEVGPVALLEDGGVRILRSPPPRFIAELSRISCRVEVVTCYLGMSRELFGCLLHTPPEGLIVEAFGSGQVPPPLVEPLESLIRAGTVVVVTSRCRVGRLRMFERFPSPFPGDEKAVRSAGAIFADLPSTKARLQLAVCLSAGLARPEIQKLFEASYSQLERH